VAAELATHDLDTAHAIADRLTAITDREATYSPGTGAQLKHLADTLTAANTHQLAAYLAPLAHNLSWSQGSEFRMPSGFQGRFAYCEIAGPDGMIPADGFRFGAYLQFPDTWYPIHSHAAEELYFILSGTAECTRDGIGDQPVPPGTLIRHTSHEGHATRTQAEPLLALWAWHGDIDLASYQVENV
jgi:mannose-6-phosphate isomerase-like protein (cupin superfamily)